MSVTWLTRLTHPHNLTVSGELRYLLHHRQYEPFGHRPGCRNAAPVDLYRVTSLYWLSLSRPVGGRR